MLYLADVVVLVGVLKLLIESRRPLLCAAVYAAAVAVLALVSGQEPWSVLLMTPIALAGSVAVFWTADRFVLD